MKIRVGLEFHQRLDSKEKLFCNCSTEMNDEQEYLVVKRKLRQAFSEFGKLDTAAKTEAEKKKTFNYLVTKNTCCLVELNEEPPHEVNKEALEIALQIGKMLHINFVHELHFMRKTVLDGSNTSGFQRTALIGKDGFFEFKNRKIPIWYLILEEEAAGIAYKKDKESTFRLSRLGIPLVEIVTGIIEDTSPEEVKEIALYLGTLLRTTGKVKRGLGTIRQDTNISIENGERCELKGLQDIRLIDKVIEKEVARQQKELKENGKVEPSTRQVQPDGTSNFLRPLSGSSRMYPETDVPPIAITHLLKNISVPKKPEEIENELMKKYKLNKQFASALVTSVYSDLFYKIAEINSDYTLIADTLLNKFTELRRQKVDVDLIPEDKIISLFKNKNIDRKAIPQIISQLAKNQNIDLSQFSQLDISEKELEKEIKILISKNKGLDSYKMKNIIMGEMMKKYRGKVSGKLISEILEKMI